MSSSFADSEYLTVGGRISSVSLLIGWGEDWTGGREWHFLYIHGQCGCNKKVLVSFVYVYVWVQPAKRVYVCARAGKGSKMRGAYMSTRKQDKLQVLGTA